MKSFKEYILESTHDSGILKAVFVIGIPGAGKSYTVSQLEGSIQPRIVNTDKATEFLSKKLGIPSDDTTWPVLKDTAKQITQDQLVQYLNGMLPLFVDGTSNDLSAILSRVGILESVGYDIGCVYIKTDLNVAIQRAEERAKRINRSVNPDFIKSVYTLSENNAQYLQSKFSFFKTIKNDSDELGDREIHNAYQSVQSFFTSPMNNIVGVRELEKLAAAHEYYLVPTIMSMDVLKRKTDGWYRT